MRFDFIENEHEMRAFTFSVGVVVLSALAVIAFIFSGGSILFYIFAVLAILLGFYMAWHISNTPQAQAKPRGKRRRQ
jgi:uncharacterized membrane protein YfcA